MERICQTLVLTIVLCVCVCGATNCTYEGSFLPSTCVMTDWLPWNCSSCASYPTIQPVRYKVVCCEAGMTLDQCRHYCNTTVFDDTQYGRCDRDCPLSPTVLPVDTRGTTQSSHQPTLPTTSSTINTPSVGPVTVSIHTNTAEPTSTASIHLNMKTTRLKPTDSLQPDIMRSTPTVISSTRPQAERDISSSSYTTGTSNISTTLPSSTGTQAMRHGTTVIQKVQSTTRPMAGHGPSSTSPHGTGRSMKSDTTGHRSPVRPATTPTTVGDTSTVRPATTPTTVGDTSTVRPATTPTTVGDTSTVRPDTTPTTVGDTSTVRPDTTPTTVGDTSTVRPDTKPTTVGDTFTGTTDAVSSPGNKTITQAKSQLKQIGLSVSATAAIAASVTAVCLFAGILIIVFIVKRMKRRVIPTDSVNQ